MTTVKDIYDFIDSFAPFSTAMDFDNAGLQTGSFTAPVKKALISLDVTDDVIQEACEKNAELIITHHPVIFNPLKRITDDSIVYSLVKNGISVISAHTNLDMAEGGVNDALAEKVGIKNTSFLTVEGSPLGRVGTVEEISVSDFAARIKNSLSSDFVRVVPGKKNCNKVALVSGSGGDAVFDAVKAGCDTLLTGDAKYNHFLDALHCGINLIEAGHFATENVIVPVLFKKLSEAFSDVEFLISDCSRQYPLNIFKN